MYKAYFRNFVIGMIETLMERSSFMRDCINSAQNNIKLQNPFIETIIKPNKSKLDCHPDFGKIKPLAKKHYIN